MKLRSTISCVKNRTAKLSLNKIQHFKRKIEVGEVKKNIDLWTEMHLPIVEKYYSNLTDVKSFENFNALVESYEEIQRKVSSSSNKMIKYLESLFAKVLTALNELQHEDDWNLALGLKYLFPNTFDFDDYLFIYSRIEYEEEKKKWRSKVLSRARQLANYNTDAMRFSFKLMELDNKYGKMIDYINDYTSYNIIFEYAERMILADKKEFLKTIFNKTDHTYYMDEDGEVTETISKLLGLLKKYYIESEINKSIDNASKSSWSYRTNMLIAFMADTRIQK